MSNESVFQTINGIVNEVTDSASELRIIAIDAKDHLNKTDTAALRRAADELELQQRTIARLYGDLIETQQQLMALRIRIGVSPMIDQKGFDFFNMGLKLTGQIVTAHGFGK